MNRRRMMAGMAAVMLGGGGTRARLSTLVGVCLCVMALLAGCGREQTFRYKLTLNVEVDGQPRSASAVIEATQTTNALCTPIESSYCYPRFSVKGVAPMIVLEDGGVILASLDGHVSEKDDGGQLLSTLPWLLYVDDWKLGPGKTMVEMPPKPPRLELPLANPKRKPTIWWVPPQPIGPPEGWIVGPSMVRQLSGRDITLVSFVIEPTREPLVEWLEPAPPWMAAYRGGTGLTQAGQKARFASRRKSRQLSGRSRAGEPFVGSPHRTSLETSIRMP